MNPQAKGARIVCEHCGRSGTPSAALRVIGLRLVQTSTDLSDTAIAASDAREPILSQELEDLASLLGEIGTRLLGIEEPLDSACDGGNGEEESHD